jgi:hypothetical protein
LLEERTVRELRRRGLLQRKRAIPTAWWTGSIAASIALFVTGMVVGQYLAGRNTARIVAAAKNSVESVESVRQTGNAYVQALEALVDAAPQSQNRQDSTHARDVALTALHQAANEVVRLAPNDPVVAKIIQGIEQEKKQNQTRNGRSTDRNIVWF